MRIIEGQCGSEGVARGPVFIVDKQLIDISDVETSNTRDEIRLFWNAKEKAKEQIKDLLRKSAVNSSSIGDSIFSAYMLYLDDIGFKKNVEKYIIEEDYTAKQAVKAVGEKYKQYVASLDDNPRIQARSTDVEDLMNRMLLCLDGSELRYDKLTEPCIVVAHELTPSWLFSVDRDKILGCVLEKGAYNSHFAILARSFDIPLLINTTGAVSEVGSARECALYASRNQLVIEPTEEKLIEISKAIADEELARKSIEEFKGRETLTRGGERIILYANASSVEEIDNALKNDAEGIGLYRTEYIYMESEDYPTEEDQYRIYKEAIQKVEGKIIVFRTADIGGDKQPSYVEKYPNVNSAMGNRGIRFSMNHKSVFKTQLRALFRASYYGIGNVNVMYPMLSKLEELDWIDNVIEEIKEEFEHEKVKYVVPEQGIVVETPAAALAADVFASRLDFLSIGTNDLSQFLFAIDRMDCAIDIEDFKSIAMRRVIEYIVGIGERQGIPVGLCGDITSNKDTLKWLLDVGLKGLSVQPRQILLFRKYIREM